jgi:hypothetical protein
MYTLTFLSSLASVVVCGGDVSSVVRAQLLTLPRFDELESRDVVIEYARHARLDSDLAKVSWYPTSDRNTAYVRPAGTNTTAAATVVHFHMHDFEPSARATLPQRSHCSVQPNLCLNTRVRERACVCVCACAAGGNFCVSVACTTERPQQTTTTDGDDVRMNRSLALEAVERLSFAASYYSDGDLHTFGDHALYEYVGRTVLSPNERTHTHTQHTQHTRQQCADEFGPSRQDVLAARYAKGDVIGVQIGVRDVNTAASPHAPGWSRCAPRTPCTCVRARGQTSSLERSCVPG